ncbi:hypothetical protein ABPG73_017510 [Tetrahymena malaccensis]
MNNLNSQPPQIIQKIKPGGGYVEDEKKLGENQKTEHHNQKQIYPDLLNNKNLDDKSTNQDKPIQIQHPQVDNNFSNETQTSKYLNNNLKLMQLQSNQINQINVNQQSNIQQNDIKMTIYLQTPNNQSYLELDCISVKIINSTETKNLKQADHYQEDQNHPLLRNWKKEDVTQKLYLYSQRQFSQIRQWNQNELELSFQSKEGIRNLKFALPQDSDVFFIDSSTLEDKLNEDNKAYDKQINSECLTEFGLQLLLKESFIKFIKFCNQFDTKFNRTKFLNQLIQFGFKNTYNDQQFDLKKFLIFLFAQSVNKEQQIITPKIKIYDIFIYLQEDDKNRISQASDQLNNCKDWYAIKQLIEDIFLKEATFQQSKDYYKIQNKFKLNKCAKDIFEAKIKSESEPNFNEIFNQEYMDQSGMTTNNYCDLFIKQTLKLQKENNLLYLEKNTQLINFLIEKTQVFNRCAYENVKKTIDSIVSSYFKDKDLIQTYKLMDSKKQIFQELNIQPHNILNEFSFNEKLKQINLEKISQEDIKIIEQILTIQNNNIDVLFQILQRIKELDLEEKSVRNEIFDNITKKIMKQMNEIQNNSQKVFQQKLENLRQTLYKIFIYNWNKLNNSQKIKQSIKFDVYRYDFYRQMKIQLVEDENSLFTNFLENNDIISNIIEITDLVQQETEFSVEKKQQLIQKTYQVLFEKLNKLEDLNEFCEALKHLGEDKIKKKIFETNKIETITSLQKIIDNLIQNHKIIAINQWDIQYILNKKMFELFFNLLINVKEFNNQSKIYQQVYQIINDNINLLGTTWKDYKIMNDKKEIFEKFIQFFYLKTQNQFQKFKSFYDDYSKLKDFINLMKKLNASDIDDMKKLLDSIDQDEDQEVNIIQEKFQQIIDKNSDLIGFSQYLVDLKLFYYISNTYQIKNLTIDETMNKINTFALPFIECLFQYLLEQQFLDRKNNFQDNELEQFKTENQIESRNCYKFLKKYFSEYFSPSQESLEQECKNLNCICEKKFKQEIFPSFFIEFIQQGNSIILDYELMNEIQKTSTNFEMTFPSNQQQFLEQLKQLIDQDDLSKKQFFDGSQQIKDVLDTFTNDIAQNCKSGVDRRFLKDQTIPFISSILNVINLHSKFKNEEDLSELLLNDENDLADRIQHYIQIKPNLEEFNKNQKKNIFEFIKDVIQFFFKNEKCIEIRQKIGDISKYKDYIQQKLIDLRTSQAQNSVKILQMFMNNAKIHISINDAYLEKNQSQKVQKVQKSGLQVNGFKPQEDERNYQVTYMTWKIVNKNEKIQQYNEEQIFQIIQRLNIISEQQLGEAYKNSEKEIQQFKENKKKFEEVYQLVQTDLIQTLNKFIQFGYLDGFIKEVEIIIDDQQNSIKSVIQNIQKIVKEKEDLIEEWKKVIEEAQQQHYFLKLLIPQCYPDLLRYFQKILNINASQDSQDQKRNSITIKKQEFGQSNPVIQFNIEEMIKFYYMDTKSLANELQKNKNQIKLNTINDKINLLGKYLNDQFKQGQNILTYSDKLSKLNRNQYCKLEAKKIQCESYGDMCKQLLILFGNPQPDKLQFFFANQQTTEMDIEAFLNRVIFFEMKMLSTHFFIIDFKKLKYQVQKFATELIDKYMNTVDKNLLTRNKLIVLYIHNQNFEHSYDQEDESTEEDCIRIPLTQEYKNKPPQYQNENIYCFKSNLAGEGKTFQIQKQIKEKNQLLINIPAHQFQNIDNLLKILRSKSKEMKKQNSQQIQGIHIEIIYDQQDKISLLLFQILVLKCISYNQNKFFNFSTDAHFYIEQSNYYNIPYANILTHIKQIHTVNIQFSLSQISVSKTFESDDQIMLRYLNGLKQGVQYLMETDFVQFEAFQNQRVEKKKIYSDLEAQQLIVQFVDQYMEKYKINQKLTYQSIVMFRQQFVTQIKEMEQDPNYTSFQINELINNASPQQKENIRQLRYNMIKIFLEQSLKNTFLNTSNQNQTQNSKNYYENYMKRVQEQMKNKSCNKSNFSNIFLNQKKNHNERLDTNIKQLYQQKQIHEQHDSSDSLFACIRQLFSCLKSNSQQQAIRQQSMQQVSEEKYLIKPQVSDHNDDNKQISSQIESIILSKEEERIQRMNTILQYDNAIKNLIFFINGGIIAAIFQLDYQDETIPKLQQLIRAFIEQLNRISSIKVNIDKEIKLRIPHIGSTEDEYILTRTLVQICSRNPSKFIDEKAQQQKPELYKILQERAFTKDNTCKLIQIAFKIYSGVPLVIMGETGIGKTVNIQILTQIMGFNFEVLRLSAGTTVDQIIKFVKDIKNKYSDANQKIVIFFDEINTNQNIYGLLKEIFIEKSINGKKICKKNQEIVCIAACNPYEYITKKNQKDFEAGLLTRYQLDKAKKANLTYHVYPLPESMLPFVVNYGQLEEKVEEKNIYQMLSKINFRSTFSQQNNQEVNKKKEYDHTIYIFSEEELKCIQQLIMTSQQFVRCQHGSSRSASLRDVSRTIKFIEFFMKEYFLKRGDTNTETQKQKSVLLSLYLCYQIRLNSQKQRNEYQQVIQYIQSNYAFFNKMNQSSFFDKTINEELDFFISQLKIDSDLISKNKALKENCFCIALCILTKVPLFITGEPGTSKTLSFTLVINSFKGISSSSIFLQGFPSIKEFYIQGNLQTESEEIRKAFQQAKEFKIIGFIPVVFFDEAGQAELSENNPNKVLHELLDDGDVSFIASSNYSLDYAKQNRCLHLQRNKNSLEDLKEFVNQLVYSNTDLKDILNDFCQVYYEFHSNLKNYIHNSRDFYYTIKYCHSMYNKDQQSYQDKKSIVNLLYRAMIKNFSGYDENKNLIIEEFKKQFQKYQEYIQYELNTLEIIEECFKPICENFVYHSRFPMLITDNTDQGIEFAKMQLNKNGLQSQIKAGSHFKKDFYEDKTREISSINACIEQNYSIISVNQDYIYAVYYDFFTMNFSRIGNKQKFRLNYKQIQTRIEVPQNYLFIMIVTKDQYMKMDLALLNRFEKHIFSQNLIFQNQKQDLFQQIMDEFKNIKKPFEEDKNFLSFVKKSNIFGMIQVESKKMELLQQGFNKNQSLFLRCTDLIGNLSKKYDIIRLRTENTNNYFQAWNQKIYLDNLIEFVKFQKNDLNTQIQAFYSIIYTNSYLYKYSERLLNQIGFETLIIDLSLIKHKREFEQLAEDYFKEKNKKNLMIIQISCQDEKPQNIYYIRSFIDECRQNYSDQKQKSIIIIIQYSNSQHYRLPFCLNWEQYQIDNLLPYVYTVSSLQESEEIQQINKILNYRNIHGKNERQILENKQIFNYFSKMPGFCSKLIQRLTFRFEPDKEKFYKYYEIIRETLENHFQEKKSIIYNHFYEYLVDYLKENSNQDDLWSYKYQLIKGLNYEKQMINYLKNKFENIILTILSQYEDQSLLSNFLYIQKLPKNDIKMYEKIFDKYIKQTIKVPGPDSSDSFEIKRLPYMDIQFIFSNIIFKEIENTQKFYEFKDTDQQYKNHLATKINIFQEVLKIDKLQDYFSDFLLYKGIERNMFGSQNLNYVLFCNKLLEELNKKQFFKEYYHVHEVFWNNEMIFIEILDLTQIFESVENTTKLAKYLVDNEVFTNKKDILEYVSEFYYSVLQDMQEVKIIYIDRFIKIFPLKEATLRFQIISQCYYSFLKYDNKISLKEISVILKEGYVSDKFDHRNFNQNQISQFLISLSQGQDINLLKKQYLQLYLLKLIFNADSNFLKKVQNSKTQKREQFLFIENFKKLFKPNNFDLYEFPWCEENYMKKLDDLEQYKQKFLVLATLKMMKQQIPDNYFSDLVKFIIYLASTMMEENNKSNQFQQIMGPQSSQFMAQIYIPFNNLTKKQIQAIQIKNILDCVADKTKVYQCSCGYVYTVGDCGKNMYVVKCKSCDKNIGGQNHINIDKEYQQQAIDECRGLISEFIEDKYFAPRNADPLAFRFGNLVIYCLIFISSDKNFQNENDCIQRMTKQWQIIRELLKLTDELLLIMSIQLLKQLLTIKQSSFDNLKNRNQFEIEFSQVCKGFPAQIPQIQQKFDADAKKILQKDQEPLQKFQSLIRDQEKTALYLNTLQYYQIPQLIDLEGQYLKRDYKYKYILLNSDLISKIKLVYPLIYFYKKIHQFYSNKLTEKISESQNLQKILENKPYLLKYYEENVKVCWNKLQEFLPEIQIGCNPQPSQPIQSSDKVPLENFIVVKKDNQTQASAGYQLFFFITSLTQAQNNLLKQISNEQRVSKDIFELHEDDIIQISQNINIDNLIYFENLQLEVGQQKKNMNTELLKNYYIFDQLSNKCCIKDFEDKNYFQLKKDTTNLGIIYSPRILQGIKQEIPRLNPKKKETFLKKCQQQEQKLEIRDQLFFLHDLMKSMPEFKIQPLLEQNLYIELESKGFIVDESYFKNSLRDFKVQDIFDLLVILETELMDDLVQNIDKKYKGQLPNDMFDIFIDKFKSKVLDVLNKKLQNQNKQNEELEDKTNKDLQLIIGRYIIRNLLSNQQKHNLKELNIFECINDFDDEQFLDPLLLDGEEEVDFVDLNIQHKYIYNLYERLAQDFKEQQDKKQKIFQSQKQEAAKNINNQQMIIFGFSMDKQQLRGQHANINNSDEPLPKNNRQQQDDSDDEQFNDKDVI